MPAKSTQGRLKEILSVIRQYKLVTNFYHQTNPQAVREALEQLGPTFIKAGQLLSTRPDLVSPAYIKELQQLQDNVPPEPFLVAKKRVEAAIQQPIEEVFSSFDQHPFASASIGQTYHAQLTDGTKVVVKVQHHNVPELVRTDLSLFDKALRILKIVPTGKSAINIDRAYQELRKSLLNEIDTKLEASNGAEFYRLNNGDGIIRVPKVYPQYSGQGVLVNQAMNGKSIKHYLAQPLAEDEQQRQAQQKERHYLAKELVRNFIKQVFDDHYFHADPHPGNILFYRLPVNDQPTLKTTHQWSKKVMGTSIATQTQTVLPPLRLVYLDFGMMGHLTPNLADGIAQIVLALNSKDEQAIGTAILAVCNRVGPVDEPRFYRQLGELISPYFNEGLGDIDFADLLFHIIHLCEDNNLQVKSEVTLLVKAFGMLENTVAKLDPELSMMEVARPFAKKYFLQKFNFRNLVDEQLLALVKGVQSTSQFPTRINRFLQILSNGQVQINFRYQNERKVLKYLEKIVDRLMVVIILAAVILGSSILVKGSDDHSSINHIGMIGYLVAILVIIILLVSTLIERWRHRK
jgi:ubiquinone biosynthesis protein